MTRQVDDATIILPKCSVDLYTCHIRLPLDLDRLVQVSVASSNVRHQVAPLV